MNGACGLHRHQAHVPAMRTHGKYPPPPAFTVDPSVSSGVYTNMSAFFVLLFIALCV